MKIDIFAHIMPPKYKEALFKAAPSDFYASQYVPIVPTLFDLDLRFKCMDKFEHEDYVQVLTVASPPIEEVVGPEEAVELAKIVNDELAELVWKYPYKFVAAVADIPMNDIDAALKEIDRAIVDLKLRGIQLYTNINGKALDSPEFIPIFERMVHYNLPIWLHPLRPITVPDYATEETSKYSIWDMLGWPYDTSVAMTRLVISGILERLPTLKIITHHAGGMISFFADRINEGYDFNEREGFRYKECLRKPVLDYYRMFYNDTAIYGTTAGLMCAYAFWGAGKLLFGTDMPYDNQTGYRHIRETIRSIEEMNITAAERKMIYEDNARNIMRLPI
jgi:predicted TIM-barrel fold metal-dependent hydrolase